MAVKTKKKRKMLAGGIKWFLWLAAFPSVLTIVMVPEKPIFLIPVIAGLIWMAGSTICTKIDEDREERR